MGLQGEFLSTQEELGESFPPGAGAAHGQCVWGWRVASVNWPWPWRGHHHPWHSLDWRGDFQGTERASWLTVWPSRLTVVPFPAASRPTQECTFGLPCGATILVCHQLPARPASFHSPSPLFQKAFILPSLIPVIYLNLLHSLKVHSATPEEPRCYLGPIPAGTTHTRDVGTTCHFEYF